MQLKSLPSSSQVPPWRQGWELHGVLWWALVLPRLWVEAGAVAVAGGSGVVTGAAVVVVRLLLKGRRVVPGGRRVM